MKKKPEIPPWEGTISITTNGTPYVKPSNQAEKERTKPGECACGNPATTIRNNQKCCARCEKIELEQARREPARAKPKITAEVYDFPRI